jgi:hypothetical protein
MLLEVVHIIANEQAPQTVDAILFKYLPRVWMDVFHQGII